MHYSGSISGHGLFFDDIDELKGAANGASGFGHFGHWKWRTSKT